MSTKTPPNGMAGKVQDGRDAQQQIQQRIGDALANVILERLGKSGITDPKDGEPISLKTVTITVDNGQIRLGFALSEQARAEVREFLTDLTGEKPELARMKTRRVSANGKAEQGAGEQAFLANGDTTAASDSRRHSDYPIAASAVGATAAAPEQTAREASGYTEFVIPISSKLMDRMRPMILSLPDGDKNGVALKPLVTAAGQIAR